jgi:hypothetical protein
MLDVRRCHTARCCASPLRVPLAGPASHRHARQAAAVGVGPGSPAGRLPPPPAPSTRVSHLRKALRTAESTRFAPPPPLWQRSMRPHCRISSIQGIRRGPKSSEREGGSRWVRWVQPPTQATGPCCDGCPRTDFLPSSILPHAERVLAILSPWLLAILRPVALLKKVRGKGCVFCGFNCDSELPFLLRARVGAARLGGSRSGRTPSTRR